MHASQDVNKHMVTIQKHDKAYKMREISRYILELFYFCQSIRQWVWLGGHVAKILHNSYIPNKGATFLQFK